MTHLKIEQSDSAIEQVSSAVITKLYELATSGELDLSSNLVGRLHTTATYLEYIDAIRAEYSELYISSDKYYVYFDDPEANRVLKDITFSYNMLNVPFGDGIGVLLTNFSLPGVFYYSWFMGNTVLQSFNELSKMTNCVEIYASAFAGCTNLRSVNLQNIITIGTNAFKGCSSLTTLGSTSNLLIIGTTAFQGCNLTGDIILPAITSVSNLVFFNNPNINTIDFGENLSYMDWLSVWSCGTIKMIFRGLNPPTVNGNDTRLYNDTFTIYIPDGRYDEYTAEAHFAANSNKIHYISELTQSS